MWDCRIHTSADTNPRYNLILFKRDHLPQRRTDKHSNSSGMPLQVLMENCFIAQKGQEYNKTFWGSLIFLTFTTLVVNSTLLWRLYPAQRLLLNVPSCLRCSAEFGHIWGAHSQQMWHWPSEATVMKMSSRQHAHSATKVWSIRSNELILCSTVFSPYSKKFFFFI